MARKNLYLYQTNYGVIFQEPEYHDFFDTIFTPERYMSYSTYYFREVFSFNPNFDKNLELTETVVYNPNEDTKDYYTLYYCKELESYLMFTFTLSDENYTILEDNGRIQWNMYQPREVYYNGIYSSELECEFVLYDKNDNPRSIIYPRINVITTNSVVWNYRRYNIDGTYYSTCHLIQDTTSTGENLYTYCYADASGNNVIVYNNEIVFNAYTYIRYMFENFEWQEENTNINFEINRKYNIILSSVLPAGWSSYYKAGLNSDGNYADLKKIWPSNYNLIDTFDKLPEEYNIINLLRTELMYGYNKTSVSLLFYNKINNDLLVIISPLGNNINLATQGVKFEKDNNSNYKFGYYPLVSPESSVLNPSDGTFCFIISKNDNLQYKPYYNDIYNNFYKSSYKKDYEEPIYLYIYAKYEVQGDDSTVYNPINVFNKDFIEQFGIGDEDKCQYIGGTIDGFYLDDEYIQKTPIHYDPEETEEAYYEYDGEYFFEDDSQEVDSDLESAITADEREIKAFVKIEYDKPIISYDQSDNYGIELSNPSISGNLYSNKLGFKSTNKTDENIELNIDLDLRQNLIEGDINGLTLYFVENKPKNIEITGNNVDVSITDNDKEVVLIDFENPINNLSSITITANEWSQENYIQLENVELGHNEIYKNEELLDMSIIEETRKFCEETPENECKVSINNYDGKFDTLNPEGIAQYLTKDSVIKPYIGAITEDGSAKYVSMGRFYLDNWVNNSDGSTTLNCKNLIKKISELDIESKYNEEGPIGNGTRIVDNQELINPSLRLQGYLYNTYGLKSNIETEFDDLEPTDSSLYPINWNSLQNSNLLNYLQKFATAFKNILYVNRNEILEIKPINLEIKQTITDNELLDEPKVDKIKKINTIKLITKNYVQGEEWYREDPFIDKIEQKIIATSTDNNIIKVVSNTPYPIGLNNGYFEITASSGTIQEYSDIYNRNQNGVFIKFFKLSGVNIGDEITIKCNYTHTLSENLKETYIEGNIEDEVNTLEFSNDLISEINNNTINDLLEYYLENASQYNVEFDFNDNIYLTAGDIVKVNTKYGDMDILIQSIEHKYDGGLEAHIKGVDINV